MSRRILLLLLVLSSLLMFSSCKKGRDVFLIGISQPSMDAWREKANEELCREASFYNDVNVEIRSVADDSKAQIDDIEYFIEKGVDLLVVSPNESSNLTPVVEKAYEKGIPVILYDRKIESEAYDAYVGADNRQIGVQMGEYLSDMFRSDSDTYNIVIIRGTFGATADIERYEGLMSVLSGSQSKFNVIATEYGNFTKDGAYSKMKSLLESIGGSRIDAVLAFNDRMANGVFKAFEDRRSPDDIPVILGVDALSGPDEGLESIVNEKITASFSYPTGGDVIIDVARKILYRSSYQRYNILNSVLVDRKNARLVIQQEGLIEGRQEKIDALNERLDESMQHLANQRRSLFSMLSLTILAVLACTLLMVIVRMKSKLNEEINMHNKKIQAQLEELQNQKNQLQALSAELEEATNAKLVFFTNISHELKTPLTLILGPVQELLASNSLDVSSRDMLQIVYRNSSKLYSLINEILDFRTFENGKMTVEYQYSDMRAFLIELNKLFYDIMRRRNIRFDFDVDEDDFNVAFDKNKLEKIYFNLISNALKHVGPSGTIRTQLRVTKADALENIELSVFNTDSYIPEDKVKDIFLRFYKIGNANDSSGVGLALTYSLVSLMGGDITVESSKQTGTSFIVTLPLFRPDKDDLIESGCDFAYSYARTQSEFNIISKYDEVADPVSSGKGTVLVIEDNLDMLNYIKDTLSNEYRILLAENGFIGVEKALKYGPDIILCDIMMPGKDGYEVCRELKANMKTNAIPIILLTACNLDEQKEKGYESGADAYMQKPFSANVLKVRIRKFIDKRHEVDNANDWLMGCDKNLSDDSVALLSKVKAYVDSHLHEDISIEEMIADVGLSKSNFYRKLKSITDYSPIDIVNLIRLRRAINLIVRGGKNFSEAAFESGFNSLSYFSRTFVKYYHVPPREWIKQRTGKL